MQRTSAASTRQVSGYLALSWKQRCKAGFHRWRGKEHGGGCDYDGVPHWHVTCRRCHDWWLELMLFDPRAYDVS